jgi:hypothetical protein
MPIGILILIFVPDFPHNSKAWWLNEAERELAKARTTKNGASMPREAIAHPCRSRDHYQDHPARPRQRV